MSLVELHQFGFLHYTGIRALYGPVTLDTFWQIIHTLRINCLRLVLLHQRRSRKWLL